MVLEVLLGVGALGGGAVLIASPTGSLIGMPLSMLEHSPFTSFLVPGLVLFFVNGVFPLVVAWASVQHAAWTAFAHPAIGAVLCGWIGIQVVMIRGFSWLHAFYIALGLALLGLGLSHLASTASARGLTSPR